MPVDNSNRTKGAQFKAHDKHFSKSIAYTDHKIRFYVERCKGKYVLDLGAVHHNPENYKSKYWLHKAIASVAEHVVGLDLYKPGVKYLNKKGFDIVTGDAQSFYLDRKFDVIAAGDIIEHLENPGLFIQCCVDHLAKGGVLLISTPNPWFWKNVVLAFVKNEVPANPEHTCYFCPKTLENLLERYEMRIDYLEYGSRYLFDRLLPLPTMIKHTTFHLEVRPAI